MNWEVFECNSNYSFFWNFSLNLIGLDLHLLHSNLLAFFIFTDNAVDVLELSPSLSLSLQLLMGPF